MLRALELGSIKGIGKKVSSEELQSEERVVIDESRAGQKPGGSDLGLSSDVTEFQRDFVCIDTSNDKYAKKSDVEVFFMAIDKGSYAALSFEKIFNNTMTMMEQEDIKYLPNCFMNIFGRHCIEMDMRTETDFLSFKRHEEFQANALRETLNNSLTYIADVKRIGCMI